MSETSVMASEPPMRHIVRAHGGELSMATPAGTGAVFAFDLEVAR